MKLKVPFFRQQRSYSCGAASLKMVYSFYGLNISEKEIISQAKTNKYEGTTHKNILAAARKAGFKCDSGEGNTLADIKELIKKKTPLIVHYIEPEDDNPWGHYAVAVGYTEKSLILNDPWNGKDTIIPMKEFERRWHARQNGYKYEKWMMAVRKKSSCSSQSNF